MLICLSAVSRHVMFIFQVSVNVENENTIFGNFKCEALNLLGKSEKDFTLKQAGQCIKTLLSHIQIIII